MAVAAASPIGAIVALHGDLLFGWAYDPAQPDERLVVEVLVDGQYVAIARADQWQLPGQCDGDGFHGFCVQLKPSWLNEGKVVSARLANGGPELESALCLTDPSASKTAPPIAEVRFDGGLKVLGWVWDPLDPQRHVTVRAYEHERCIAESRADLLHPALIDRETADHGFMLDLPWSLADGKAHRILLQTDQGQLLPGGAVTVCHWPDGLTGLLRQQCLEAAEVDPEVRELILTLSQHQDRRAPRALGFAHYAPWHALYERPDPLPSLQSPVAVGVLLYGDGDGAAAARSRESVERQRWPARMIEQVAGDAVLPGIGQLLGHGCEAVLPLRIGDQLAEHAIDTLVCCLRTPLGAETQAWVYADSDRDDGHGGACDPWLKPAWDFRLFLGVDLVSTGLLLTAEVLRAAIRCLQTNPPPLEAASSQWHLTLAAVVAVTETDNLSVVHLPRLLYRRAADNARSLVDGLDAADQSARRAALQWLVKHLEPGARVEPCPVHPALTQVVWPLPEQLPTVSCIIPTRDRVDLLRPCVEGLLRQTDYPSLEIIVIDNGSSCPETLEYLAGLPALGVRVLPYPHPFNYAAMNNLAVDRAAGELVCLLNNDILIREAVWLKAMVRELLRPNVGAVGAKLLWPNSMVQHAGVVVGIHGLAAHVGNHWQIHDLGYLGFNQVARYYSALTAACLLLRRSLYQQLDGLDAANFPVNFNDVDLCLRIRERGFKLVWTPHARLEHLESASRGHDDEPAQAARSRREEHRFRARWCLRRAVDPAYHPGLAHDWGSGPFGALHANPMSKCARGQD
ncbi:glycosyltransferase family 2 protein [Halochromatium roseum]|uniref:glycosyltransferase family 2 protein n=1 Tax=Halochromatium roseum TaxID=391920 RepID=UPI0019123C94|nr:glycosyltransferase family 2 protein [Halochromatium roseum]MBK5938443.1 hypothetical protein [Halochromatium roseum]